MKRVAVRGAFCCRLHRLRPRRREPPCSWRHISRPTSSRKPSIWMLISDAGIPADLSCPDSDLIGSLQNFSARFLST